MSGCVASYVMLLGYWTGLDADSIACALENVHWREKITHEGAFSFWWFDIQGPKDSFSFKVPQEKQPLQPTLPTLFHRAQYVVQVLADITGHEHVFPCPQQARGRDELVLPGAVGWTSCLFLMHHHMGIPSSTCAAPMATAVRPVFTQTATRGVF